MNDKYVLCFRGENKEGKEEILKIYEASLSNIDKYISKYKDVVDDLRESNIITENEYNKIYDLHIRKESKESYKKDKFFTNILCLLVT